MPRIATLEIAVLSIYESRKFYRDILELKEDPNNKDSNELAQFFLENNSVLILKYDERKQPLNNVVKEIGIEYESFEKIDDLFGKIPQDSLIEDVRVKFKNRMGVYGFYVRDPNGYIIKVHKYNWLK